MLPECGAPPPINPQNITLRILAVVGETGAFLGSGSLIRLSVALRGKQLGTRQISRPRLRVPTSAFPRLEKRQRRDAAFVLSGRQ